MPDYWMNVVFMLAKSYMRWFTEFTGCTIWQKKLTTIFGCCCSCSCCWFTVIWCFAYAVWQPNLPLINFTIRLSWFHITDTEKVCIQTNILVSDDSDKGQAELAQARQTQSVWITIIVTSNKCVSDDDHILTAQLSVFPLLWSSVQSDTQART